MGVPACFASFGEHLLGQFHRSIEPAQPNQRLQPDVPRCELKTEIGCATRQGQRLIDIWQRLLKQSGFRQPRAQHRQESNLSTNIARSRSGSERRARVRPRCLKITVIEGGHAQ